MHEPGCKCTGFGRRGGDSSYTPLQPSAPDCKNADRSPGTRQGQRPVASSGNRKPMRITFGHLVCLFGCFCGLAGCGIFGEDKLGGMTVRDAFKDPLVAEMVEAASSCRLWVVDAKIKAGANANYVGTDGITPLLRVMRMNRQ